MSTPVEPTSFATPPGALPPVTFGGGGQQTFKGQLADGLHPVVCVKIEACVSTFEGKTTPQYAWLFQIEGRESDGELCWYTARKLSTHPKAKLGPTLDVLKLARPTPDNPHIPNPVGAKARMFVKNEPRRDGTGMVIKPKELLAY